MKNSKKKMSEDEVMVLHDDAEKNRSVPSRPMTAEETEDFYSKAGLQSINLRLPTNIIEKLKNMAGKDGLKYQPYVRRLVIQYVNQNEVSEKEKLRAEIREIVKEELEKRAS